MMIIATTIIAMITIIIITIIIINKQIKNPRPAIGMGSTARKAARPHSRRHLRARNPGSGIPQVTRPIGLEAEASPGS